MMDSSSPGVPNELLTFVTEGKGVRSEANIGLCTHLLLRKPDKSAETRREEGGNVVAVAGDGESQTGKDKSKQTPPKRSQNGNPITPRGNRGHVHSLLY